MLSRGMLSKEQFEYFTSQKDEITNLSENKKRVLEKVDQCLDTMRVILDSDRINQQDKDEAFNPTKISYFINSLTQHNPDNSNAQEVNKQEIILDLIQKVLSYYQSRYKDKKFMIKEINKFKDLANDLKEIAEDEQRQDEASIMYKQRKIPTPPILYPVNEHWTAECIFCFAYSSLGKTEQESIKKVRHSTNCSIHKEMKKFSKTDKERVIMQFYKIIPPQKKTKKD